MLIAGGLLFLIGAIRDWKWVYQATDGYKARHAFIFEVWREKGYRVFIGICGLLLVICGVVFLMFDKRQKLEVRTYQKEPTSGWLTLNDFIIFEYKKST